MRRPDSRLQTPKMCDGGGDVLDARARGVAGDKQRLHPRQADKEPNLLEEDVVLKEVAPGGVTSAAER